MRGLALLLLLLSLPAFAHKGSDVYWTLHANGAELTGRIDVALKDLEPLLHLDTNGDTQLTWGEVRAKDGAIREALISRLGLSQSGAACPLTPGALRIIQHSDGNYVALDLTARCPASVSTLDARYELLFDLDATHRGLLSVSGEEGGNWLAFTSNRRTQPITFSTTTRAQQTWLAFLQGVHHIAIGWDHLCFLFALLLPSVLRRTDSGWEARDAFKPTLLDVAKVVTAFTLAHSLTLALAAFDVVTPNAKWVEVAIAVSVALAALNNLLPFVPETRWSLAFSLGLMHGFGFVSAIRDLGSDAPSLWLSVFGFNLGVEAGQLGIVALFVPGVWGLRNRALYVKGILPLGSAIILGVAMFWTQQRL